MTAHDIACKRCHGTGVIPQATFDPPAQCDCGLDGGPSMPTLDELRALAVDTLAECMKWARSNRGTSSEGAVGALSKWHLKARPEVVLVILDENVALRAENTALRATPPAWTCQICGAPATCFGAYDNHPPAFACSTCCGHGNEDGRCMPVAAEEPEEEDE